MQLVYWYYLRVHPMSKENFLAGLQLCCIAALRANFVGGALLKLAADVLLRFNGFKSNVSRLIMVEKGFEYGSPAMKVLGKSS